MQRFLLAFVCAVVVSLSMATTTNGAAPRRYAHWTFRPASADRFASLTLDKPAVISTDAIPYSLCDARGYARDRCISAGAPIGVTTNCACAATWTRTENGRAIWATHADEGKIATCREFVVRMRRVYPSARIVEADEVCLAAETS